MKAQITIALLTTLTTTLITGVDSSSANTRVKCKDFATQQEAQAYMTTNGATYLDSNGDGKACESLPQSSSSSSTNSRDPVPQRTSLVPGVVVSTGDGDTLRVNIDDGIPKTVRLAFVDAPEMAQAPFGQAAAQRLKELLPKGQQVSLRVIDTDRYERSVAVVYVGKNPINLQMVKEGYAVVYRQYLKDCRDLCIPLAVAEEQAKRSHLNFWSQTNPVMPWDYRRSKHT